MSRTAVVYPGIASENRAVLMDEPLTWARWAERMLHPEAAVQLAVEALQAGRHSPTQEASTGGADARDSGLVP